MKRTTLVFGLAAAGIIAIAIVAYGLVSASEDGSTQNDNDSAVAQTPEPTATTPPPATSTPVPVQPTTPPATATPRPDTPVSSGPLPSNPPVRPAVAPQPSSPNPGPPPPNTTVVEAPIDNLDILTLESFPPQYALKISAGLPSGCAKPYSYDIARSGTTITVKVTNPMAIADACTLIYGMYDLNIGLGSDFQSGVTYTVIVNNVTKTFVAQ